MFNKVIPIGIMAASFPLTLLMINPNPPAHKVAESVPKTTPAPIPVRLPTPTIFTKWDTRATDPTAYYPNVEGDAMADLPEKIQEIFACIRHHESRNHPTSVNATSGAGGLYQFMPEIWAAYNGRVFAPRAELATPEQQSSIAAVVYNTNGGFFPEWQSVCTKGTLGQ